MWHAVDLHSCNGGPVAVKLIQPLEPTHEQYIMREIDILQRITHPNVAVFIANWTIAPNYHVLVLEHCGGGSLKLYLKKRKRLEERDARAVLLQILAAMSHLNSLGIIHYDVKPANIMFDSLMIVKIIDFGWSKTTVGAMPDGSVHCSLKGGTVSYKPPEGYDLVGTIR